ncbi:MED6 mediator sub complex component-domain-containing protein [Clohesyomyces aquaticus]|uniref:Mediator of RNA polymerase II transcription subunit 6 n=1 Tax=Clohesyomyces aquaticus TaxID=1231657 RepID=A0A1Y1ZK06_9PLEO|nr:MED6 mediator sub complex component-domain-containing protein [Clohesyomyces aquaticus]
MAPQPPPLDEQEWADPSVLLGLPGGNVNSESILWYFMNSIFYDPISNNTVVAQDAGRTNNLAVLNSRKNFESLLKTKDGTAFLVAAEPQAPGQPWVIQRQFRTKGTDEKGHQKMEVRVTGTYYTVGEKILMSPNMLDILQARMLSITTNIQEFFELGRAMSHFAPATGHTYLPPSYEIAKAAAAPGSASRAGSPGAESVVEGSQIASAPAAQASMTEYNDDFFMSTLNMVNKYGHEFMDENPLQGEPGAFVFTSTKEQVEARNKAQAAARETGATLAVPVKSIEAESTVSTAAPTPKSIAPEGTSGPSRKGSIAKVPKLPGEKRRKSKGLTSPTSPTGFGP